MRFLSALLVTFTLVAGGAQPEAHADEQLAPGSEFPALEGRVPLREGTVASYTISNNLHDLVRETNLTVGGTGSFIRSDGERVDTYEIWSDQPAFFSISWPTAIYTWPDAAYHRPNTVFLFETDQLDFVALRPEGPRENVSGFAPLVRLYHYPPERVSPGFLPHVDAPLFLGLAPLHLGFQNTSIDHRSGRLDQTLERVDGSFLVSLDHRGPDEAFNATMIFDERPFPVLGTMHYEVSLSGGPVKLTWTFQRTSFVEGTGETVVLRAGSADHQIYEGTRTPVTKTPFFPGGPALSHPSEDVFNVPDMSFGSMLETVMRHPDTIDLGLSQENLFTRQLTWSRYPVPLWVDDASNEIPPRLGQHGWSFDVGSYGIGSGDHLTGRIHAIPSIDGHLAGPVPWKTHRSSDFFAADHRDIDLDVVPVEASFDRFIRSHGHGDRLDLVAWWVWFVQPFEYWILASGCDPWDDQPATVVFVHVETMEAHHAFYGEPYSGFNKCNPGLVPPLY